MHVTHIKEKDKILLFTRRHLRTQGPVPVFGAGSGSGGGVRLGRGCAEMVRRGGAVDSVLKLCGIFCVEFSAGKCHEQTSAWGMWLMLWKGCLRVWETDNCSPDLGQRASE